MRLRHILGPSIMKDEARMVRALKSPRFIGFVFLNGGLMMVLNPSPTIAAASLPQLVAIWAFGSGLFIPIYMAFELAFIRFWVRPGRTEVSELLVMCLTLTVLTPMFVVFGKLIGVHVTDPREIAGVILFTILMLQVSSYICLRFVDRLELREILGTDDAAGEPLMAHANPIFIPGTTLLLSQVELIIAHGRQTEVITRSEAQISRMRFGDLVAELPMEAGFQIHRSVWVSRSVAAKAVREGRKTFFEIRPGRRLPIARERERAFDDWQRSQSSRTGLRKPDRQS